MMNAEEISLLTFPVRMDSSTRSLAFSILDAWRDFSPFLFFEFRLLRVARAFWERIVPSLETVIPRKIFAVWIAT